MNDLTTREPRLNIHPGEWYFGNEYSSLYTVLGSCVALSVWHPTLKVGGLCHYLLARQPKHLGGAKLARNGEAGRYGSSVLPLMMRAMQRFAPPRDYELGLFGGCDVMLKSDIGKQNILFAQEWLQRHELPVALSDLGGTRSRTLILNLETGLVELKHYAAQI